MAATPQRMKAVRHDAYGGPELLELRAVELPAVRERQALVHVRAAGLHVGDCFALRGAPFAMRLATGLLRPKCGIPGFDLAGQVVAVGARVTRLRPGDEVFGACEGACAEFAVADEGQLAPRPAGLRWEEAAALPTSGLAALHGLRDAGRLRAGQRVLINGASGGIGTFAVQIAKALGAEVTGVCSSANVELVRALGADHVVDYTREDFTRGPVRYDLILDNVENRSLAECRRALAPGGTLLLNSGTGASGVGLLVRLVKPLVLAPFARQKLRRYLSTPNRVDLLVLKELVEAGRLRPVVGRTFALAETAAALRHVESGRARGKVVVELPAAGSEP
jgi:NADPH:quinone reductase-like Zn-dependent oxidoreductase